MVHKGMCAVQVVTQEPTQVIATCNGYYQGILARFLQVRCTRSISERSAHSPIAEAIFYSFRCTH